MEVVHLTLILCVLIAKSYARCNFPPSLWCSSKEIASACQVLPQCEKWNAQDKNAPLVNFTLYYESLCPDCRQFITKTLYPVYQEVGTIMHLFLVPYGNAREHKEGNQWKFECQHGKEECLGNIIETCVIRLVNNIPKGFGFINCIEKNFRLPLEAAKDCAKTYPNIPLKDILTCANSTQGNEWEHEMALKTNALKPPHQFVPWVTLNGVHTYKIQKEAEKNLKKLICDTYTGPKPQGCSSEEIKRNCKN